METPWILNITNCNRKKIRCLETNDYDKELLILRAYLKKRRVYFLLVFLPFSATFFSNIFFLIPDILGMLPIPRAEGSKNRKEQYYD